VVAIASVAALVSASGAAAPSRAPFPAPFQLIAAGPFGGSAWQGVIRSSSIPALRRPTVVYLPPAFSLQRRYPVLYLLQGFPGPPYEYLDGLRLPQVADRSIASGRLPPFVAVVPPAGLDAHHGDWTGMWETYLVDDVVPWADATLPLVGQRSGRALAGLSAGGYGAVDIGLRHPSLFGTLESWSGYFSPLRAGALHSATASVLAVHDPLLLVRGKAALLRRLRTRFFLSAGTTRDRAAPRRAPLRASDFSAG